MATRPQDQAQPSGDDASRRLFARVILGVVRWATASNWRMGAGVLGGLLVLGGVFATWSYVAHLAVDSLEGGTIEMALAALDEGRLEDAMDTINRMRRQAATPSLVGGAMFVVGAIKVREADKETSAERRSAAHLIASKYLQKGRAHGVPRGREPEAAYLLGKSLALSGQLQAAVGVLEEALTLRARPATEIHALLVSALLESPRPNLESALAHNDQVVRDASLAGDARDEAWLLRAETLLRLNRHAESLTALAQVDPEGPRQGRRLLILGRLESHEAAQHDAGSPQRVAKAQAAVEYFLAAQRSDPTNGRVAREAIFWTARCHELLGDREAAKVQYGRLTSLFGDTSEGLAASFAEAENHRLAGDYPRAIAGYRTVLHAVGNPHTYESTLLPLSELLARMMAAYEQFVRDELFAEALATVHICEPIMPRTEGMELRARTHLRWGVRLRDMAAIATRAEAGQLGKDGRMHLRAAGRAYEDLARMRYATRYFTRDLWTAAECYLQGQGYSSAARAYEEFLHHEARQHNDVAFVRLGQARLALGDYKGAVAVLEECIEMLPDSAMVYEARLEAARAYQRLGKFDDAERLLRANLSDERLNPPSHEWKYSLFELGHLLYGSERYEESLQALDEAVRRYPDDKAALLTKYVVARAYHNAAEELSRRLHEPANDNEAQINRNRKAINDYLENAHAAYVEVQQIITLTEGADHDPLARILLRNCYFMQGSVLVELGRFDDARQAYQNVISRYQDDPVVLESFVQAANCWRRLDEPAMARGNLERAKTVLAKLPADTDFLASTNFDRAQWALLLDEMSKW